MWHDMRGATVALVVGALCLASTAAGAQTYPWHMLKDSEFKRAYYAVLGERVKERWLARLDGPANPIDELQQGNEKVVIFNACKPHNCDVSSAVVLYVPEKKKVYIRLYDSGTTSYLGKPSKQVRAFLDAKH